nr:histidine kinase [Lysinibacter cavernae]
MTAIGEWGPAALVGLALSATGLALGYRGRPLLGTLLVAAAPLAQAILGVDPIAIWSIGCFIAFLFTLRGAPGLLTGLIIGIANFGAAAFHEGTLDVSVDASASIAAFAALVGAAAGAASYGQRQYWSELEGRVEDAVATRDSAIKQGVAEERVRIARDLHDSIGHEIAVVSMHLGSAEAHLEHDPAAVPADLAAARAGVQSVLVEVQGILKILRVGDAVVDLAPTPQHGGVPQLVESFRSAGMTLETELDGLAHPLAQPVSAAAYRIVQEALTNAQKHGTGTASLRLSIAEAGTVSIEVVSMIANASALNHPSKRRAAEAPISGGHGIIGMRERAASVGGTVTTRSENNLFWLTAELPPNGVPTA